jgi:small subunit ribosomal protein S6
MQLYQLDYLISPEISEQDAQALGEKIKSLIEKDQGSIVKTELLSNRVLAYEVKNFTEAFLAGLSFNLEPEKLEELKKTLESEKNILRYMVFKKKLLKDKLRTRRTIKVSKEIEILKTKPKRKVELKEIEKKLDEILGE